MPFESAMARVLKPRVVPVHEIIEPRIQGAVSEGELDSLVGQIQAGFEAGSLSQVQAEHLAYLVWSVARQLAGWPIGPMPPPQNE